ncbi:MAG: hypothetical protein HC904_00040 [Blastochloris sp.]|nr:hypothetical protein [Blastochloris sp.]
MNTSYIPWKSLSGSVCVGVLTEGWALADVAAVDGGDRRCFWVDVAFSESFASVPLVQLGLTGFDMDQRHSSRLVLQVVQVQPEGFRAQISTWRESLVYSVSFHWLAIGA